MEVEIDKPAMIALLLCSASPTVQAGEDDDEDEISGRSTDLEQLENDVEVSHVMADRVRNVQVAGILAAESCDDSPAPAGECTDRDQLGSGEVESCFELE